ERLAQQEHVSPHAEPVIRLRSPALRVMPCRPRCVLLALKRATGGHAKIPLMRPSHIRVVIFLLLFLAFAIWAIPTTANFIIEYNWWKEVAQVDTWVSMLWYNITPAALGSLLAFIALYASHARGLHFAGIRQRDYPVYSRLV